MTKDERPGTDNASTEPWQECRTMHELGDGPRPPITQWLRHLAYACDAPAAKPSPAA